jgi:hypothetical protein
MTFSEKLENIPKENWKDLETYLNEQQSKGVKYARHQVVAREVGVSSDYAIAMLSELCDKGVLSAKIKIYCTCGAQHGGVYQRQSEVPSISENCVCGNKVDLSDQHNWRVVYEIPEGPVDFFRELDERLKLFSKDAKNLPRSFFEKQFEELSEHDSPQRRGQLFDYFLGLLIQQLDGSVVRCRYNQDNPGELDVIANFSRGPDWALNRIGCATGIENKWEKEATSIDDVGFFQNKLRDLDERHGTKAGFFVSIGGFTADAEDHLNSGTPRVIGLGEEDVRQMGADATAEHVLDQKTFY